ncbi:Fe-S cluster assembly protein SufD [Breznakia sp. PF5-3]|uniref:SufD family Fe-S cluster assembly protein n=1 Tax=unclassified Breznakia TaxID=2623764 RepID=UPI002405420E|nr:MULTISPECIES: SufD family Fe-S cluster assembly protein [unclassified Breznakia]MDF9823712.1 Fe-S cluster assembly protein SufD [Breznakia sp. PM6-1]MDF9834510.1 Fe-S cluster assembly protein SufD [Breznakia sp. PF5-3]MDF9837519.1 Fe-S cluster assembly protein SufD [Breznakia sp. PFB2-8]MDF9859096.1 Fe-S cluster assembly protein SufD [Breznakia sp. PH5-24]
MEKITEKTTIEIQKDGYYEYTVETIETLSFHVLKNVHAEIKLILKGSLELQQDILLEPSSSLHMLSMNECKDSKMNLTYHLKKDSELKIGYYELNENTCDLKAKFYLEENGASVDVVTTSITSAKKIYDIGCIHIAANTNSNMSNYEISKQHANYKITACGTIKKGAYQSKSHQTSRILTLHEDQRSEAIPVLLIDENDVEASHANSMGKMNAEDLYYLQSRGISDEQAKELLTMSYLLPITDVLDNEEVNAELVTMIRSRMGL